MSPMNLTKHGPKVTPVYALTASKVKAKTAKISMNVLLTVTTFAHASTILLGMVMLTPSSMNAQMTATTVVITPTVKTTTTKLPNKPTLLVLAWTATNVILP